MEISKHPETGRIFFINGDILESITPRTLFSYLDEGFVPVFREYDENDGITHHRILMDYGYGFEDGEVPCWSFVYIVGGGSSQHFYSNGLDAPFTNDSEGEGEGGE